MSNTTPSAREAADLAGQQLAAMPDSPVPPAIFVNVADIPWSSFPGHEHCAQFKLLRIDPATLGHTMLFRYRTGVGAHRHLGEVEILNLSPTGHWSYVGEGTSGPGDYTYEYAGSTHVAITENDEWGEALIISRGPLQMINEDGAPGFVVDAFAYYHAAAANNAVGHLPYPFTR